MIKSQREYEEALRRLEQDREVAVAQRQAFAQAGLTAEEVERAMEPLLSFQAQLAEEVEWYEQIRTRNFAALSNFADIGRLLIALRIANGLTQRELAERLGIHESQVSRDERNEYYGVSLERAQRVLEALGERVVTHVEERQPYDREPLLVGT